MCVPLPSIQGAELGSRRQAGEVDLQSHQPGNAVAPRYSCPWMGSLGMARGADGSLRFAACQTHPF